MKKVFIREQLKLITFSYCKTFEWLRYLWNAILWIKYFIWLADILETYGIVEPTGEMIPTDALRTLQSIENFSTALLQIFALILKCVIGTGKEGKIHWTKANSEFKIQLKI